MHSHVQGICVPCHLICRVGNSARLPVQRGMRSVACGWSLPISSPLTYPPPPPRIPTRTLPLCSHPIRKWVFGRCFYLRSLVLQTPMVVVGITVIPGAAVMLGRMVSHHHVLASCFHAMSAMHAKLHFVLPSVERSPTQPRCDYPSPSPSLCSAGSWVCFICISNSRLYNALVYQHLKQKLSFLGKQIYMPAHRQL